MALAPRLNTWSCRPAVHVSVAYSSFLWVADPPLRAKIFSFALGFIIAESAVIGLLTTSPASFKLTMTT